MALATAMAMAVAVAMQIAKTPTIPLRTHRRAMLRRQKPNRRVALVLWTASCTPRPKLWHMPPPNRKSAGLLSSMVASCRITCHRGRVPRPIGPPEPARALPYPLSIWLLKRLSCPRNHVRDRPDFSGKDL